MDAHDSCESPVVDCFDSLAWDGTAAIDHGAFERSLWVIVSIALVADVHLTYLGLQHGLTEGNPFARWAIGLAGIGALALAKVAALGIAVLVRRRLPRHGPVIALGLAVPWATAVALNAVTLAT